jgi:hypothetical protein
MSGKFTNTFFPVPSMSANRSRCDVGRRSISFADHGAVGSPWCVRSDTMPGLLAYSVANP